MGKLVISSCTKQQQQQQRSSSSSSTAAMIAGTVAAAGCLTLRSGRRVPGSRTSQQRRGSSSGGANSSHCCRSRRIRSGAAVRRRPRLVVRSPLVTSGDRPEQDEAPTPAPAEASDRVIVDDDQHGCTDISRHDAALEASKKHRYGAADLPMTHSPPPGAEMEAFFAAAELAERRRFSETYNYDVALDRPLEGRFEWTPVNT
ncbi:hypothetical protein QOZ80_9BG0714270 [Eleusine coracana subsp. coracana]|nr:hypothetical protein QOZ80_9BG0714270 [Eleusine coracana subsp. coracana]